MLSSEGASGVHVDEHHVGTELLDLHFRQAEVCRVEVHHQLGAVRVLQRAVSVEGPVVIGADEGLALARAVVHQARAAVGADVVEGAQHAVHAACHDDVLIDHRGRDVAAGLRDLRGMGREQPIAIEDLLLLLREDRRVVIVVARQGAAVAASLLNGTAG